MEVKSVTTIVSAEKTTANARYDVSYSIVKDASSEMHNFSLSLLMSMSCRHLKTK